MSADDLRFTIRAIRGIFQKGRTIAAIKAIFSVIFLSFYFNLVCILNKEK
jgi:predicted membrane-bound mannosyltransferase